MSLLAQKLLAALTRIARRSDVTIHQQTRRSYGPIARWQAILPADMFEFYKAINGISFYYDVQGDEDWNGLRLLSLDRDGKKLFNLKDGYMYYSVSRQKGSRFPQYFFQSPPQEEVTFFFGDTSTWGVLMMGTGEEASFYKWNNDGDISFLARSFTEVIEQLIAHSFAHTWAYSAHPQTKELLAKLAAPAPLRQTFELTITARQDISGDDHRRSIFAACADAALNKLFKLLNLKPEPNTTRDGKIALLAAYCADLSHLSDDEARAVMTTLKHHDKSREAMLRQLQCGVDSVTRMSVELKYLKENTMPLEQSFNTLIRALSCAHGSRLGHDFPADPELLASVGAENIGLSWLPLVSLSWDMTYSGDSDKITTFHFVTETERVDALKEGQTYASTALPAALV